MKKIAPLGGVSNPTGFAIYGSNGIMVTSRNYQPGSFEKTAKWTAKQIKEYEEWHAVEHKLIWLLVNGHELTLENLREAPTITPNCGTNNRHLREPSADKLKEAIAIGLEYRELIKVKLSSSPFFSSR